MSIPIAMAIASTLSICSGYCFGGAMQFAARFGIKKNFQKPVFVIEREDDYSKQEYSEGNDTKKFYFEDNATQYLT